MDFNYTKIKFGNWLFKKSFPLYNIIYTRFKNKNDREEITLLKQLVKPGYHVLDIGANVGFYARILSRLTGDKGHVYCFEPDTTNFNYLQKNAGSLSNVTLFHNAVSDKAGILKVYKSKLLNVDHRTYPVNNYDSIEEIPSVAIDELVANGSIKKVDLIKIDIQGYELVAFKGMQALLKNTPGLKIVAEYWPHGFNRAGSSAIEFFDFFTGMGYQFSIIESNGLKPLSRDYVVANNSGPFEFSYNVLISRP